MENKYVTAMITIDLSVAFNMVDHDILLNTLHCKFGISDNAIEWVKSYLRPRSCKVNIKNSYNKKATIFSVPQGSVAGSVLYLAYASTVEEVIQKENATKKQSTTWNIGSQKDIGLYGFADDHAIKKEFTPTKVDDESQCIYSLEQCLINIKAWMDSNRLRINNGKKEFILFGSRSQLTKCTTEVVDVNGTEVPIVRVFAIWGYGLINICL